MDLRIVAEIDSLDVSGNFDKHFLHIFIISKYNNSEGENNLHYYMLQQEDDHLDTEEPEEIKPLPTPSKPAPFEQPEKPERLKKQEWAPLDLSHGPIKKGIFGPRRDFKIHVRKDLKTGLGKTLTAGQREEVADELAKLRQHGLSRGEVREGIKRMVKEGKLNRFEAKRLRRELGATKSSSIF